MIEQEKREIRSYTRRERKFTARQEEEYNVLAGQYLMPFVPEISTLERFFSVQLSEISNSQDAGDGASEGIQPRLSNGEKPRIVLDIGFGNAENLLSLAKNSPDILFLAVEVNKQCIFRALKGCEELALQNLRVIHHDAVQVMSHMIPAGSISAIHIFFPDPWPKKRHHKRRLINIKCINMMQQILACPGYIHFVSDWEDYALSVRDLFHSSGHFMPREIDSKESMKWWHPTHYEKKGKKLEHDIHHLIYDISPM